MQSAVASCSYSRAAAAAAAAAPAASALLRPAARSSPPLLRTPSTHAGATASPLGCRRLRQQPNLSPLLRASASSATAEKEPPRNKTVADIMTKGVLTVTADATVDEALDLLVSKRITGLPVVDGEGKVIGVVSDFDLLSLDIPDVAPNGIFPAPGAEWASFFSAQVAASKGAAVSVRDVMTSEPLVVRGGDAADAAARTLLSRKVRRLPVVDDGGKLIGLFSRSDVLKAAWEARRGVESGTRKQ